MAGGTYFSCPTPPHHKFIRGSPNSTSLLDLRPFLEVFESSKAHFKMTDSLDYVQICESCPAGDGWGPSVTTETTLNGVPYAPYSKGDKLGRMADWTSEGKDRERGGRSQYGRNFRGTFHPFGHSTFKSWRKPRLILIL